MYETKHNQTTTDEEKMQRKNGVCTMEWVIYILPT